MAIVIKFRPGATCDWLAGGEMVTTELHVGDTVVRDICTVPPTALAGAFAHRYPDVANGNKIALHRLQLRLSLAVESVFDDEYFAMGIQTNGVWDFNLWNAAEAFWAIEILSNAINAGEIERTDLAPDNVADYDETELRVADRGVEVSRFFVLKVELELSDE